MKKIVLFALFAALALSACTNNGSVVKNLTPEEAKSMVADFINNNLMPSGQSVSIKELTEEGGLYKVVVNTTDGQEINSYLTKDGTKFFPQVMDVKEIESQTAQKKTAENTNAPAPIATAPKAEKANVELFIMSHCPYGTQIEKGILPVVEALGDKMDFQIKFCDYAMHGEKEVFEELNQYCIQKNEPDKYYDYLSCFLEAGDGEGCLDKTGINTRQLTTCAKQADTEFKVTELFNDQSTWKSGRFPQINFFADDNQKYGVGGSPTLVINGAQVKSARDSASLLATICSGFDNPPAECAETLSSAQPSPGFGYGTSGSGSAAECGS